MGRCRGCRLADPGTAAPGWRSILANLCTCPIRARGLSERSVLRFVYVSLDERRDIDLLSVSRRTRLAKIHQRLTVPETSRHGGVGAARDLRLAWLPRVGAESWARTRPTMRPIRRTAG